MTIINIQQLHCLKMHQKSAQSVIRFSAQLLWAAACGNQTQVHTSIQNPSRIQTEFAQNQNRIHTESVQNLCIICAEYQRICTGSAQRVYRTCTVSVLNLYGICTESAQSLYIVYSLHRECIISVQRIDCLNRE